MDTVADGQAIGALDPQAEAIEDLHDLHQKVLLRWIAHGEHDPGFLSLVSRGNILHIQKDPPLAVALLVEPEKLGNPLGRRDAHVVFVIDPEDAQQFFHCCQFDFRVHAQHGFEHPISDIGRDTYVVCQGNRPMLPAIEVETLNLQLMGQPRYRRAGMGEFSV